MLARILRDPLSHFIAIGALIFGAWTMLNDTPDDDGRRIEITAADIRQLSDTWTIQWRRPPDPQELAGLVEQQIREEVLYREALALGLDDGDTIIRRRLAQKMEFLAEDLSALATPSDAGLQSWFEAESAAFREPPRLSFSHVYFSPDKRGESASDDARQALQMLRASQPADAGQLGDRFLMQADYQAIEERDVAQLFGNTFAAALFAVEGDDWQGPLESGYGLHLVRIHEREPGRLPALEEVRERVLQEYAYAQRRKTEQAMYDKLRSRYQVVVSPAAELAVAGARD